MGLVSPTQSNPGDTIEAADVNTPVNELADAVNGNIDTENLADGAVTTPKLEDAAISTAKIADDAVTDAKLSGIDKSNLTTDSNPYKFRAYRLTTQAHTTNVSLKIQLNTEDFDTNNNFDSTTNYRYTAPVSGFYWLSGTTRSDTGSAVQTQCYIYKNGAVELCGTQYAGIFPASTVSGLVQLAAGDYVELWAYWGANNNVSSGRTESYLGGFLVSRT
jgi:hypothetical protein